MTPEAFLDWARLFPEPLFLVTTSGTILAGNGPAGTLVGLSGAALAGRSLFDLVTTPPAQVDAYLRACARTRSLLPGGLTFRASDGRQIACRAEGAVLRPPAAQAAAVLLLRCRPRGETVQPFIQINERLQALSATHRQLQRAHAALHEQREWFEQTLISIGDAVIATDVQGRVMTMNAVAEALTGWTEAEARGQAIAAVFPIVNMYTREAVEAPVAKVLHEGMVVGLANHTLLIARDGTERPIDDSGAPIRDPQGRLLGVVLVFRDVTERKRAEAALRHMTEQAQQAAAAEHHRAQELAQALSDLQQVQAQLLQSEKLAALGRLSAGIAHELNSPLQGLLMLLSVYLARVSPGSREADQLAQMRAACEHMAAIVADLTTFARPASEDKTMVDLREVVETTLGFSAVHLRHQDIRVTTHVAEPLPPIYGNKSQLQQVLLNLLQNASDAIEGPGEIVIRVAAAPPEILVQVSDSGVGMAPEHLAHIFEPFFTTKVPGQGTGLGLAVSLGIIEAHGGTIHVESTPEVGTTVSVRLPVAPSEPAVEGAPVCLPES